MLYSIYGNCTPRPGIRQWLCSFYFRDHFTHLRDQMRPHSFAQWIMYYGYPLSICLFPLLNMVILVFLPAKSIYSHVSFAFLTIVLMIYVYLSIPRWNVVNQTRTFTLRFGMIWMMVSIVNTLLALVISTRFFHHLSLDDLSDVVTIMGYKQKPFSDNRNSITITDLSTGKPIHEWFVPNTQLQKIYKIEVKHKGINGKYETFQTFYLHDRSRVDPTGKGKHVVDEVFMSMSS